MLTREANARFEVTGEEARLDAERKLALYRIAQEALRNAAKRARAQNIAVTLAFDAHEATATIEDDGGGFDSPAAPTAYARAGHLGLMGMQEHAQLFDWKLEIGEWRLETTRGCVVFLFWVIRQMAYSSISEIARARDASVL